MVNKGFDNKGVLNQEVHNQGVQNTMDEAIACVSLKNRQDKKPPGKQHLLSRLDK